jgi:hypothetical protein
LFCVDHDAVEGVVDDPEEEVDEEEVSEENERVEDESAVEGVQSVPVLPVNERLTMNRIWDQPSPRIT